MLEVDEKHLDKLTEAFYLILKGQKVEPVILPDDHPDNELKQLVEYVNRFVGSYNDFTGAMTSLAGGKLDFELPKSGMTVLQLLKGVQSSLRHHSDSAHLEK